MAKAMNCHLYGGGEELVSCLKKKSVEELLSVRLQGPPFTTHLGPIIDKVIVDKNPLE